jgi:hypothetical protein
MDPFANFTREENHGKALFVRNCANCHLPVDDSNFFLLLPRSNGAERPTRTDAGLGDFTLNAQDFGRFKSPSLRNVEVAGPYMHDGSLATLDDVIDHYSRNFKPQEPLEFTDSEKRALVAFLKTLTDHAFLTDPKFSDPFEPAMPAERPPVVPIPLRVIASPEHPAVDDVVARVMAFDADDDGHVRRQELPERMHDIVARGDRNGIGSLNRDDVRAIASSQTAIDVPRIALNLRPAPEISVDALLGDLGLDAARRDAALAATARTRDEAAQAAVASVERFREEVRGLLDAKQLVALSAILERPVREPVPALPRLNSAQLLMRTVQLDHAMGAWSLRPMVHDAVRAALARHRERVTMLATQPAALLRRLEPILTTSELGDLVAAIRRHQPSLFAGAR